MAPSFEELFELIVRLQRRYPAGSQHHDILNSMMNAALSGTAQPGLIEALKTMEYAIMEQELQGQDLELETAIGESSQRQAGDKQQQQQQEIGDDDDEEANLQRALELSMIPDDEQEEAADKNQERSPELDEETRLAIELSMQQDNEVFLESKQPVGLWGIVVDSPEEIIPPERQRRLALARKGKSWKPNGVEIVEETDRLGNDEELYNELLSLAYDLETKAEPASELMRWCIRTRTTVGINRTRASVQLRILQRASIQLNRSENGDIDIITRLQQAMNRLRSIVEDDTPTVRWLDNNITHRAIDPQYACIQQIEPAFASGEGIKRVRSSNDFSEPSPKRTQPSNDAIQRLVVRFDEITVELCSNPHISHAVNEILEHARRLRRCIDNLGSNVDGSSACCNASFVQLVQLAIQAMPFSIDRPTTRQQRVRFFGLLETASRMAGTYFGNIVRRPEEIEGFNLVDVLVTTIINEVIEGTALYEEYLVWQTDQERGATAQLSRLCEKVARRKKLPLPRGFMD